MAIATKRHNPGFLSDAELRQMFCVRTGEFESIIETLRENTGGSNQQVLVVGPRGSGKTTLLLRVESEIRSDSDLSDRLYPIVFAEESYGVSTCGEFWLECLSRLAEQVARDNGGTNLRRTVAEVRTVRDDRLLRERCLGALLDFADRGGKRLVLGVENLNMMFSDMMDADAGWCLRKTLQTEPRIMMIGTATTRFGEIDRPDRALYDLFRVLTLRGLDRDESAILCATVVGKELERGVARRLQILTGGSPRLLAIMARFGAARSFRTLMADLLEVVDEHTAYFKSHLESLPPQERRVYLSLAALWKPATTREIADRARMETSKCSAHLKRLIGRGVVTIAGGTSRRRQYYVSERLYNIYYLLRRSRGEHGLARALVDFMDAYYSMPELEGVADRMIADLAGMDTESHALYEGALEQLGTRSAIAWHIFEEHPRYLSHEVKQATVDSRVLFDQASARSAEGDDEGALAILAHLIDEYGSSEATTVRDTVATALVTRGLLFFRHARNEDAIVDFEDALQHFGATTIPEFCDSIATALLVNVCCLMVLDRLQDAIVACDELIHRFPTDDSATVAESVAHALLIRGTLFGKLGQSERELQSYDALLRRYETSESRLILGFLASALADKAYRLSRLERWEESIAACEALTSRFADDTFSHFTEPVGRALILRITGLGMLDRIKGQRAACDEALRWLELRDRLASEAGACRHDETNMLWLRFAGHVGRMVASARLSDRETAGRDFRTVLDILPQLDSTPVAMVEWFLAMSRVLDLDQMATDIRQSQSADRLLPLTTAFELEMGLEPKVAIEVLEVAQDIRRDLARIRKQQGVE